MVKTFSDNLEPIEVELIDKDGNKTNKKGKYLTAKDLKKLDEIMQKGIKSSVGNFDILAEQMSYIFGGKPEEYLNNYSFPLLKSVMDYVKEVFLINPLQQVQK